MNKVLCFDLDGVICFTKGNNYTSSKPIKKNIQYINKLYDNGHIVKIFTARHMTTCKGNLKLVKKKGYLKTKRQLKKWGVKYHEFIMGKPSYDLIIDDKGLGFKKNWLKELKNYLNG